MRARTPADRGTELVGPGARLAPAGDQGQRAGVAGEPDGALTWSHAEAVMGTTVSFAVHAAPGQEDLTTQTVEDAIAVACAELHRLDALFSTWDPCSPMSALRRGDGAAAARHPEFDEVFAVASAMREATAGWFDPWAMPGGVDPTGVVKGWAVERAIRLLAHAGVASAVVNGGGDVATIGVPPGGGPWRIGIRHPWRADALACVLAVSSAVATSGSYERGSHLVDPHTGATVRRVASASVVGSSLTHADAWATALAVGGDEVFDRVTSLPGYGAYV
ncbi:MAG: FAD:protein FMN transferase, partial [Acidimicrobiales bacterium]